MSRILACLEGVVGAWTVGPSSKAELWLGVVFDAPDADPSVSGTLFDWPDAKSPHRRHGPGRSGRWHPCATRQMIGLVEAKLDCGEIPVRVHSVSSRLEPAEGHPPLTKAHPARVVALATLGTLYGGGCIQYSRSCQGRSVTVTTGARQEPHGYRIGQGTNPESAERTSLKTGP